MNRKILVGILFLSIFMVDTIYAQSAKSDSLERVLKLHNAEDTIKVNLLNRLAYDVYKVNAEKSRSYATQAGELSDKLKFSEGKVVSIWLIGLSYAKNDTSKAYAYYQKALKLAEEIKYVNGIANCLNSLGLYYKAQGENSKVIATYQKGIIMYEALNDKLETANWLVKISMIYRSIGNYDEAIEGFRKALNLFEKLDEKTEVANCLNSMGIIFAYQGNYPLALDHFQRYLKIKEKQSDGALVFTGLINVGNVYVSLSDYPKALEYFQKALKIAEQQSDNRKISNGLANIGYVYLKTGNPKALEFFQKALFINKEVGDKLLAISTLIYIGDFYLQRENYERAMENYSMALKSAEVTGKKRSACEALNKIGTIFLKQKKYSASLSNTLKSLAIANELKLLESQKDIHYQLSEIYAATNDYKNAFLNYKLYKDLGDSLFNEENIKKITGLEYTFKYEKEKQANELRQQKREAIGAAEKKQQRTIIFSLILGIVLMSIIVLFVFRWSRLKHQTNIILFKQKAEIEEKNEELLQMNEEISTQKDEIILINAEIETKNNKLKELNATKDKFFNIIAHDLKNPFNAILGFSETLVNSGSEYNQYQTKEIIGMMHSSAQDAYKLLENLLEWSRSQTGGIDYQPKDIVLKELVVENESLCKNLAKEKNISVHILIPGNLIVYADPNMLSTIMRNLITNAIKFTPKGGNIKITSIFQNNENIISVGDTGIGMTENTMNKLFKINERTFISGTENESGTGLGLLLCKEFVEKHKGKIWVESELGKGSEFRFSIPAK